MAKKKNKPKKHVAPPKMTKLSSLTPYEQVKEGHWLDMDLANHNIKIAKRQSVEAKIAFIRAELREAEAELRRAEAEIAKHAGEVEYRTRD